MPTHSSYLESYYNIIPEAQKLKLLEIIKARYEGIGEEPSPATLEQDLKSIIAKLDKPLGDPHFKLREGKKFEKVSSSDYNSMMDEAYVDLGSLYIQDNIIEDSINKHALLNKSALEDVRVALRSVRNDVTVNTIIKENKTGITDAKFDNFYKDNNQSMDPLFRAWVDTDTNTCKLAKGAEQSVLSAAGMATADISLRHYGGGIRGTISSEENRKEKAIDGKMDTFWAEVILTDEPISQTYKGEKRYGAICEIVIKFFRLELINYLRIDPFTNYPVKILGIKYRPHSAADWEDIGVGEEVSSSTMEFNFSEVEAREIMIVVNQENPSINTYNIPRSVINNAEIWQQIVDRELSISSETEEPIQATQDMIDSITGWQAYVDAMESYGKRVLEIKQEEDDPTAVKTVFDATTEEITKIGEEGADVLELNVFGEKPVRHDELVEVRKYEYLYGAYEIDIKQIWFMDKGVYRSPRYETNGAVVRAEIAVSEVLPSGTNIEYSLSTDGDNWKNVLPHGYDNYIYRERVDIDPATKTGILRFPATNADLDQVYRNQTLMPSGVPDGGGYVFDQEHNAIEVRDSWYLGPASYTASYTTPGEDEVVSQAHVADFSEDPLRSSEDVFAFGASRNFKVELHHPPFIEYRILNETEEGGADPSGVMFRYAEGRWLNVDDQIHYGIEPGEYYDPFVATVDGYASENRTDYYEDIRPALTEYNNIQYPYYEYFQIGKNLYFNTPIEDKEIRVKYKYLNDYVQLRALLRENDPSQVARTPVLVNYTLKLRTT